MMFQFLLVVEAEVDTSKLMNSLNRPDAVSCAVFD